MLTKVIGTVEAEGDRLIDDIRQSQKRKGLDRTGRSAKTLRPEIVPKRNGVTLRIWGSRVFRWLQDGRRPNRTGKPGRAQIEGLTEWVQQVGLPLSAVWPIAIKQAKEGITVPNAHNPGGVLSDAIGRSALAKTLLPEVKAAARYDVLQQLLGRSQ